MRNKINIYIILLLFFSINAYCKQAPIDKAKVISAYIYKFAGYTTWPNEEQLDYFRIAVFSEDRLLISELEDLAHKRNIKGKTIKIIPFKQLPIPEKAQIVYVPEDKSSLLLDIYDRCEGKQILIVSEEYTDKHIIMINLFRTSDNKIQFEVNNANIINQNLSIDPEVLLAGGTEIDVASLYRKSQIRLRDMQKSIDIIKDSIDKLKAEIEISLNQIKKQELDIEYQKILLKDRNDDIEAQSELLESHKQTLAAQKDSIQKKNAILTALQAHMNEQINAENRLKSGIALQDSILKVKQYQIEELNNQISSKDVILDYQADTIQWQKRILSLIIIIGILVLFLITAILIGYRNNRKKSKILANQKMEIEEKLVQLEDLNQQLQNADRYKSIFLASMSHELRTPLNSIIGYTGIILMGMAGELNEEQTKQLNKVKNNAKHLLSLINDILDISKIEADKVELDIKEFSILDVVNEVYDTILPRANEKGLDLVVDIPENLVISTDLRRLKQVVLNIAINAVNYTEKGFVKIKSTVTEENKIRISVIDTGLGIPEHEQTRLFQPFQQIDSSLTKKNKGTGLGLYLCRKIMKLLGGEIFVVSKMGDGSEFYLELPLNSKN
jgi:signal transduction histidine kinase